MREVLVRPRRDPLGGMSRGEVRTWLRGALRGRAREAYFFGSFARDEMQPGSDIDCIVVTDTGLSFPERGRLFDDLRDRLPALAILVYTPEEFRELTADPSPGFWTSVSREMERVV